MSSVAISAVSACNRFGLGARPGELARIDDPRGWLIAQVAAPVDTAAFAELPSSADYHAREADYLRDRREQRRVDAMAKDDAEKTPADKALRSFRQAFGTDRNAELDARYRLATTSPAGFRERLVHFWSNHFAVSADKRQATLYAAPMEREAIRPHVTGRYVDLLLAVESHPAMLRYLDNTASIGAESKAAERAQRRLGRRRGLNENLAREILELHTLGVDGGYTQADVTELARALTGWSTPTPQDRVVGQAFVFRAAAHEPGPRTVLGKRYPEAGLEQGRAILADLARHPSTSRHLATKLARHFVADTPPPSLIDRLARSYREHDGDLGAVCRSLIDSKEAWQADVRKFKTPDDFLVSALRALGSAATPRPMVLYGLLERMGQPPFVPRSPAGFPDAAASWNGSDALFKRIQAAESLADRVPVDRIDAQALAIETLGKQVDHETLTALRRAESPRQALALLLASPAFQWRS